VIAAQSEPGLARRVLRLVATILAVQAFYWLVIYSLLDAPRDTGRLVDITASEAAPLARPDPALIAEARFTPFEGVFTGCCEPAHYVVRFHFALGEVPADGLGVTPSVLADNAAIFANGQLVEQKGRMELPHPTIERLRTIWFLPPGLLRQGDNTLEIITARASMPYTDVNLPRIGPYGEMQRVYAQREFQFGAYQWISMGLLALIALGALLLFVRGGRDPALFWLGLLSAAWGVQAYIAFWTDPPFVGSQRVFVWSTVVTLTSLGWEGFANEWGGKPLQWLRWPMVGFALAKIAASAAVVGLMEWPQGYDLDGEIYFWSGIAFSMVALALFLRNALLSGLRHPLETALFVLLAVLLAAESLIALQISPTVGGLEFTAPLILVAIVAAFLSRNVRLFRSMEEYNLRLATELAAREQQIAESYAQRQELARQQALLSERQRIMRDMHDGMGGRLMSIAAQLKAQGPAAPREQLADELLEALDELRLIVDSLDTAGDDLGMALGAFRARMEGKLAAAGIESEWTIDEDAAGTSLSASAILDIYRIMQEACANMLRYSGADHFEVALRTREDGAVVLELADNGKGIADAEMDDTGGGGKGLANMRSRAARIGGQIGFAVNAPGLKISLLLPPQGA
jgi:two-component system, NarL family, sensor histidine kinase UhpB